MNKYEWMIQSLQRENITAMSADIGNLDKECQTLVKAPRRHSTHNLREVLWRRRRILKLEEIMNRVTGYLSGKKTYLVATVAALTAGAQALGYEIPDWLYTLEGALGLGMLRVAVAKPSRPAP